MSVSQLSTFRIDVTPPTGHPLCAGWKNPSLGTTDSLYAMGVLLAGEEEPIVLCAIDWSEISNRTYLAWQNQIAAAVGTTPSRVSIHCIHAHCSPWPDIVAQQLVEQEVGTRAVMDVGWCGSVIERIAEAARAAKSTLRPVTHISTGRAKVDQVASNRRVFGEDGKVKAVRWTTTRDAAVRAEPEGQIDPYLKTITFWNKDEKLAVLHYYAVHPSSFEDDWVTPDFAGLARERRIQEDNGVPHLYFTECAGDITAGKYNDGSCELREVFTQRVLQAMVTSEEDMTHQPLRNWSWRTQTIHLPPREDESVAYLKQILGDRDVYAGTRNRAAIALAYHERIDVPLEIGALHLNEDVCVLHLPGESFIEYQHYAQEQRPDAFVTVPSYGDCGPGYICLERSFDEGGYEPTDSFVTGSSEAILKDAIGAVLGNE